jgi:hypothetical protein
VRPALTLTTVSAISFLVLTDIAGPAPPNGQKYTPALVGAILAPYVCIVMAYESSGAIHLSSGSVAENSDFSYQIKQRLMALG